MLSWQSVPDMSPQDQARERRIAMYLDRAARAISQRGRLVWERAAQREIARRSDYVRAEMARAEKGEDGW
jgi:hypothetical protein